MFTGIVSDIGTVISKKEEKDILFGIETKYDLSNTETGSSISCSGVCLTIKKIDKTIFYVNVSRETFECTNIKEWEKNKKINLERPLKINDEIGGHIVSGHVDATSEIKSIESIEGSYKLNIAIPEKLQKYITKKGSITLEGVSLTVNEAEDDIFSVNIIPFTWEKTTFQYMKAGDKVNLEIDILARYIEKIYLHNK